MRGSRLAGIAVNTYNENARIWFQTSARPDRVPKRRDNVEFRIHALRVRAYGWISAAARPEERALLASERARIVGSVDARPPPSFPIGWRIRNGSRHWFCRVYMGPQLPGQCGCIHVHCTAWVYEYYIRWRVVKSQVVKSIPIYIYIHT